MAHFAELVAVAVSRGMTEREFAARLGIHHRSLWRLKEGRHRPTAALLDRAVTLLGLTAADAAALDIGQPLWLRFHKSRGEEIASFHEQLRDAKFVLTISSSMDSYLQDEWMLEWSNRDWIGIPDWQRHRQILYPYARQQAASRQHSNFRHRLVFPWAIFTTAKTENIDWLAFIRNGLGAYEDLTMVTPIHQWQRFYQRVDECLPEGTAGWDKVCIVDDVRTMIHVAEEYYVTTWNESATRDLKEALDRIILEETHGFFREQELKGNAKGIGAKLRNAAYETECEIEKLLRSHDDLARRCMSERVFLEMLDRGQAVPATRFRAGGVPVRRMPSIIYSSVEPSESCNR